MDLEPSGAGLVLPTVDFQKSEPEPPAIIKSFDRIYQAELQRQIEIGGGNERPEYPRGRALKESLRAPDFKNQRLANDDIRNLVDYLLTDGEFTASIREWVKSRGLEWERRTLPQNTYRVFALAKSRIKDQDRKK